jgi:subtilase family serine protease
MRPFSVCSRASSRVEFGVSQKKSIPLINVVFVISLLMAVSSGSALAAQRQQLPGHVPGVVAQLQSTGRLPGETQLHLVIGLPLRNQQGLSNLFQALYDPASPQYRHFLKPEQFTEQFGPTVEDYQAVANFVRASGFTITATHSDRMLLEVSAKVSDIERAFQISMRLYPHPTEKRSFYASDADPTIPAELRIADISGLNNYSYPRPKNLRRRVLGRAAKNTSMDGSGPNGNLIGSDFRACYAPGVTNTGTGQSVGLLEFDGFFATDISSYEGLAGLTSPPPVNTVLVDGYTGVAGSENSEVALDIEMVESMAPGLSEIVCFETSTNNPVTVLLSAMATNETISQFTCSWDFILKTAVPRTTMDNFLTKFIMQGQSFFDASGDEGAYVDVSIPEPDDDPYMTLVGGTTLATSGLGASWDGEVTWNAPDLLGFSGGGITPNYPIPSWQAGVSGNGNGASTTQRNMPDVSMVADNIFIIADNGQSETTGGTSASAQLWGGFMALINQQAVAKGKNHAPVGFINTNIYEFYKTTAYAADFDDITVGNNTNGDLGYFAMPGYDLCTGLGTPTGSSLMIALAAPDGFVITPGRGIVATGPSGGPFNVTAQTLSLANSGANSLNWSVGGVPAWLNVSSKSGTIASGGTPSSITVDFNSLANKMAQGVYTANLLVTNLTSGQTQVRQITLQVGQNLVHDGGFETGDEAYWIVTGIDTFYTDFVDDGYYTGYTPHSGQFFEALGQTNELSFISQPLPTLPGQPYLISFWLANPLGDTPNQFVVGWNTATSTNLLYNQTDSAASSYENIQLFAVATSDSTILQFGNRNDLDFFTLDDISVVPIPLPTPQAIQQEGQTVNFAWNTVSGLIYQLQYTTNLAQGQWTNLGPPTTANGSTLSASEVIGPSTQAFYRVILQLSL